MSITAKIVPQLVIYAEKVWDCWEKYEDFAAVKLQ